MRHRSPPPLLVGVLDLMGGVVVRAIAGRRDEYRPVVSRLCDSPDPLAVAGAFRDRYGIENLYVADLDAILRRGSNAPAVAALAADGFRVTLDAGLRAADDAAPLFDLGVGTVVAGLETLAGPRVLEDLVGRLGPERVAFSLDLADGVPLADPGAWGETDWTRDAPVRLARQAAEAGVGRLIVLDLHAVGTSAGPATVGLCRNVTSSLPGLHVWTGGGVRSVDDVRSLTASGAAGVLVASALHDRTLALP